MQSPVIRVLRRLEPFSRRLLPLALLLLICSPALSVQLKKGELQGSLDSTVSYGTRYRLEDPDPRIVGVASGGTAFGVNADTGTLNYDSGIASNLLQLTTEFQFDYKNFGGFFRGTAFYDHENEQNDRDFTPLTDPALRRVGSNAELLDAFLRVSFDVGRVPVELRLGEQVISWGESTLIQNSINTINPVDVSKLRLPGAELRQALLPEGTFWGSLGTSPNAWFEFYYQYDWTEFRVDPPGTYFSTNDFVGEGGNRVMLGFGGVPEGDFLGVYRGANRDADDQGQYGAAFRWFVPALNDTEIGFYFINYHSRLPLIGARTGTVAGLLGANNVSTVVAGAVAQSYLLDSPGDVTAAVIAGIGAGATQDQAGLIATTLDAVAQDPMAPPDPTTDPRFISSVGSAATDAYAKTANYHIVYPEDIRLFGLGFNTTIGSLALQGEVSHRLDAPLQIDDIEILFAALSPLSPALGLGQLGPFGPNQDVVGFVERDLTQVQSTVTKLLGPTFGADRGVLLAEVGWEHVHDFPQNATLRLNGPGTFISGNDVLAALINPATGLPVVHNPTAPGLFEPADRFADADSWGYRVLGRLEFNNAIGPVGLAPRFSWLHDVGGNSPGPGGPFLEDRKALTVGLAGTYLNAWSADLSYTRFYGAGRYNLINDRDFIGFNVKYAF